jgi:hypothetical protein
MLEQGSIYNAVVSFFEGENWSFTPLETEPTLRLAFQGDNGQWTCYAKAREEQGQFIFYSLSPITVPPAKRPAVAEFILRANYGLVIGNFEMHFDEGSFRFKSALLVDPDHLNPDHLRQAIYFNVMLMDKFLPGFMEVIYGNVSPAEAVGRLQD